MYNTQIIWINYIWSTFSLLIEIILHTDHKVYAHNQNKDIITAFNLLQVLLANGIERAMTINGAELKNDFQVSKIN